MPFQPQAQFPANRKKIKNVQHCQLRSRVSLAWPWFSFDHPHQELPCQGPAFWASLITQPWTLQRLGPTDRLCTHRWGRNPAKIAGAADSCRAAVNSATGPWRLETIFGQLRKPSISAATSHCHHTPASMWILKSQPQALVPTDVCSCRSYTADIQVDHSDAWALSWELTSSHWLDLEPKDFYASYISIFPTVRWKASLRWTHFSKTHAKKTLCQIIPESYNKL